MDYFPFVQQDKQLNLGPRMYQKERFFFFFSFLGGVTIIDWLIEDF